MQQYACIHCRRTQRLAEFLRKQQCISQISECYTQQQSHHPCQQCHHQNPAEQRCSHAVFTLAAHPQQKQKAYQHRPCAIGHKDLGYIHCISSPARLIPQGRQPLFYTVSICIIYPAAPCLQGLASKRAAAQQFVQRPLRNHPLQFSQARSFAEILFCRKLNSPLPARRSGS